MPGAVVTLLAILFIRVDRPNLFVKFPATPAGFPAIEECIAAGIPVNVTLLCSLDRHRAAANAYLQGLRRLQKRGGDLGRQAQLLDSDD